MKFATKHVQHISPHLKYVVALPLGKLEIQICCVSQSALFKIESQRPYWPVMFSRFKTA